MARVTVSTTSGSTYVASANSGAVMIVAGFELTSTTRKPSSRSTRQACVAEKSHAHACPITIAADPISRMDWRSSRRGISGPSSACPIHQVGELGEEVGGVVRPGHGLGVVLGAECGDGADAQAL